MAELKSTIINGKLKVNGDEDITSGTLKVGKVSALSSAGGSTYTTGTSGQVLKSNGSGDAYWANESGSVTSVNGKTGAVSLSASDVSALPSSTTYLESASASGNTLTITPSSGAAVTFTPTFSAPVTSVNNKTGAVSLDAGDVGALPTAGGQMTGPLTWKNGDALPSKTLSYILGIDAFASGGETGWQSKDSFLSGYATQSWVSSQGYKTTDTNTTYTFAEGSNNGEISVTPSGGTAQGVKVHGLGSAAYASTGTSSGNVPVLDSNGKLNSSTLPAIAITDTFVVNSQAAMLALTAEIGDVCVRTDLNKSFILKTAGASTLANWQELLTPTDAVESVNGKTGTVSLTASDVGALASTTSYVSSVNGSSGAISNVAKTNVDNSFTTGQTITRSDSGAILSLESAASDTNFLLKRTNGATCVLEAGGSVGLFGTKSNHSLQVRTNYVNRMTFDTSGGVTLATDVASSSNSNQIATTKWVKSLGYKTTDAITSVNGQTGAVALDASDVGALPSDALDGKAQIIILEDNGTSTAGTWIAKTNEISAYEDGQVFLYKITVAGASTTTLNITGSAGTALGAKTVYRYGTTKLTTQYAVGTYILLVYNSTNTCFRVVSDYDANSYAYVRQYQHGNNEAGTASEYPLLARYNLTNKNGSYDTAYSRFHTEATLNTSTGALSAPSFIQNGKAVATQEWVSNQGYKTSDAVTSVNTKTGAVSLTASDVGALPSSTTYVSSVNGSSGAITNVAKTNTDNSFSAGQTISGALTLYAASGDSPRLTFQRGTLTDTYNDWSIYDTSGHLHIQQRGSGSSAWETRAIFTQQVANFYGTLQQEGSAVATQTWVTDNYLSKSNAGDQVTYSWDSSTGTLTITSK